MPLDAACNQQQWPYLRHDVGLHISIVVLAGPHKAAAGLEALWWCHGLAGSGSSSAVWQHVMRQHADRAAVQLQHLNNSAVAAAAQHDRPRLGHHVVTKGLLIPAAVMALRQPQNPYPCNRTHLGHHVVDEAVLIPDAQVLKLLLVLGAVDLVKDLRGRRVYNGSSSICCRMRSCLQGTKAGITRQPSTLHATVAKLVGERSSFRWQLQQLTEHANYSTAVGQQLCSPA